MYEKLKRLARSVMGRRFLLRLEVPLRYVYSLAYRGRAFYCPVCSRHYSRSIDRGADSLCPGCGSLSRHRRLIEIVRKQYLTASKNESVLDISPARSFRRAMKKDLGDSYVTTDLNRDHPADFRYDLAGTEMPREAFGLIICYHVLEHIPEDTMAMENLYAALKHGGTALIQTPFAVDGIHREDPSITTAHERRQSFGQEDHVRIYSLQSLSERLQSVGFDLSVKTYPPDGSKNNMQLQEETVLFCLKPKK